MAELGKKDKEALAYLYELEQYTSLKKFLEIERVNIATKLLLVDPNDVSSVAKFQGAASALKQLHLEIKQIHKRSTNES